MLASDEADAGPEGGAFRPIFAFAGVSRPIEQGAAYSFMTYGYDGDCAGHVVGAVHKAFAMPNVVKTPA